MKQAKELMARIRSRLGGRGRVVLGGTRKYASLSVHTDSDAWAGQTVAYLRPEALDAAVAAADGNVAKAADGIAEAAMATRGWLIEMEAVMPSIVYCETPPKEVFVSVDWTESARDLYAEHGVVVCWPDTGLGRVPGGQPITYVVHGHPRRWSAVVNNVETIRDRSGVHPRRWLVEVMQCGS